MVAVRYALEQTNAAEPAEDPPIADGSLTPVLEEVCSKPTRVGKQVKQREDLAPPAWLNGQTIAIVSTVLTVGVGIGAMVFSATSSIRGEVSDIRGEVDGLAAKLEDTHKSLTAEIRATRLELREEIRATRSELRDEIKGLDARVRVVEQTVAGIEGRLSARQPATQGASLSNPAVVTTPTPDAAADD